MAGFFDNFFGGGAAGGGNMLGGNMFGDLLSPEQQAALRRQGMLQVAAKLLESSGPSTTRRTLGQTLGGALSAGAEAMQSGQTNAVQQMLLRQKLEEGKQTAAQRQAFANLLSGPEATIDTPVMPANGAMPPVMPPMAIDASAAPLMATTPGASPPMTQPPVVSLNQAQSSLAGNVRPPATPTAVPVAPAAARPTVSSMVANLTPQQRALLANMPMDQAAKFMLDQSVAKEDPTAVREYQFARSQGYQGSFTDFKTMTTPNTRVVLPPGPNQFVGAAGGVASGRLEAGLNAAEAANSTLRNIDLITPALDTAVLGPAADYRTTMLRVGQQLGIAGADANQTLADTRQVVQGLARSELDAAAGMKGQGQITESERALLRRTAAGDQTMTAAEIRTSMAAMQKLANQRLSSYQELLKTSENIPGFREIAPMFQLQPYQSQFNLGTSLNLGNKVQQELERRRTTGGAQ